MRIDSSTSGTIGYPSAIPASFGGKDTSGGGDVQLLLPLDTKKQRKQVKQILLDRGMHVNLARIGHISGRLIISNDSL